tara:strand:+ start:279 stop:719 length:441 start_codon:yes stop_codon:yes gene_type:complete
MDMTYRNERKNTKFVIVSDSSTEPNENIGAKEIEKQDRINGWFDCRYHKIIKRDGTIEDGRDIEQASVLLAAPLGDTKNKLSISVCLVGGKDDKGKSNCNYTFAQYKSLKKLQKELDNKYNKLKWVGLSDETDYASPSFDVSELMR